MLHQERHMIMLCAQYWNVLGNSAEAPKGFSTLFPISTLNETTDHGLWLALLLA